MSALTAVGNGQTAMTAETARPDILSVEGLTVAFQTDDGPLTVVDDVSFGLAAGRTTGMVGESGSGKSVSALALLGLLPPNGRVTAGRAMYRGTDLLSLPPGELRPLRGSRIAMVFQEPMTALNPVFSIGDQIAEVLQIHQRLSRGEAWDRAVGMLRRVGIPDPATRALAYPHQLSGGMRQRAVIAMALACGPDILIADEATTALDATVQAQILELMTDLQRQYGMAVLFISHDLGVVSALADDVVVLYAGRVMERAPGIGILRPAHAPLQPGHAGDPAVADAARTRPADDPGNAARSRPAAGRVPVRAPVPPGRRRLPVRGAAVKGNRRGELRGLYPPRPGRGPGWGPGRGSGMSGATAGGGPALIEVEGLTKRFELRDPGLFGCSLGAVHALTDVDLRIERGETLAVVGESGCGKSTLAKCLAQLHTPTAGAIRFEGEDISAPPLPPEKPSAGGSRWCSRTRSGR